MTKVESRIAVPIFGGTGFQPVAAVRCGINSPSPSGLPPGEGRGEGRCVAKKNGHPRLNRRAIDIILLSVPAMLE